MRHVSAKGVTVLALLCAVLAFAPAQSFAEQAKHEAQAKQEAQAPQSGEVKTFTIAAVSIDSVPFWLPSTIQVYQGDRVRLVLKNMMGGEPDVHGFAIPAYHIAVLVPHGATKVLEFTANKVGIFRFICQIHANHLGGQIVVHPRPDAAPK
jgi:nitrous oxide reductase